MDWMKLIPSELHQKYEFHNYRYAVEIMSSSYPEEFQELMALLSVLKIPKSDLIKSGGNESAIPKRINHVMRDFGWEEIKLSADLYVKKRYRSGANEENNIIENYVDGHNIDYVKGKIAFDLEWNSKDQTFDRDLYAFRAFFDCNVISAAVLLTRSEDLNPVFKELGIMSKYGASTTWMGKLKYRLDAGRNGGCPVLAIGIKREVVENDV